MSSTEISFSAFPSVTMPFDGFGITDIILEMANPQVKRIDYRLIGSVGKLGLNLLEFSFEVI